MNLLHQEVDIFLCGHPMGSGCLAPAPQCFGLRIRNSFMRQNSADNSATFSFTSSAAAYEIGMGNTELDRKTSFRLFNHQIVQQWRIDAQLLLFPCVYVLTPLLVSKIEGILSHLIGFAFLHRKFNLDSLNSSFAQPVGLSIFSHPFQTCVLLSRPYNIASSRLSSYHAALVSTMTTTTFLGEYASIYSHFNTNTQITNFTIQYVFPAPPSRGQKIQIHYRHQSINSPLERLVPWSRDPPSCPRHPSTILKRHQAAIFPAIFDTSSKHARFPLPVQGL